MPLQRGRDLLQSCLLRESKVCVPRTEMLMTRVTLTSEKPGCSQRRGQSESPAWGRINDLSVLLDTDSRSSCDRMGCFYHADKPKLETCCIVPANLSASEPRCGPWRTWVSALVVRLWLTSMVFSLRHLPSDVCTTITITNLTYFLQQRLTYLLHLTVLNWWCLSPDIES